jgi:hypothetical protein
MRIFALIFFMVSLSAHGARAAARESTFVGNGGNLGDVEILVTKREIQESMGRITHRDESERSLCACTAEYENHPICAPLRSLNEKQVGFCGSFLARHAESIKDLVSTAGAIEIIWTHERMNVALKDRTHAADAVANSRQKTITVNLDRYMELKNYERMMLITHELLHFESHDGKPLVDEGPIGPFDGNEGGRQFINAVAAAATLEAATQMVLQRYRRVLDRPQNWRRYWFDANGGSGQTARVPDGAYGIERFYQTAFEFRSYMTPSWGLMIGIKNQVGREQLVGPVNIDEQIASYSLGATYRWFIFHDPLTFFGQSHVILKALAGYQKASLTVSDGDTTVNDTSTGPVYELSASYYLPAIWNFWLYLGASYEIQSHQYSKVPVKYDMNKTFTSIGVSYGF